MKLTPLDIHHKEFRNSLRGYAIDEVDKFLDDVADEFERLFKENIDLSERLEAAREQIRGFEAQKETLHNTLVAAQRSAEDITARAQSDANSILKDAEVKAKEIIHDALTQKQKVASELVVIKQAEEDFRATFSQILQSHLKAVTPVPLADEVTVLLGRTEDGVVGDVQVGETEVAHPAPKVADPMPEPSSPRQEIGSPVPVLAEKPSAPAPVSTEPPASGFVQAIALGELASTDLEAEVPVFEEPREFVSGSMQMFGESDDDDDIEEID